MAETGENGIDDDLRAVHDRLRAAVEEFDEKCHGNKGVVNGFVLFTSSTWIDDDGDMMFNENYSVGLGSDLTRAIGLVRIGTLRMERDVVGVPHHHHCVHEIDEHEDDE